MPLTLKHKIRTKDGVEEVELTPMKAIRRKCLDCCGWQPQEVRLCTAILCSLYPYRMGRIVENSQGEADFEEE